MILGLPRFFLNPLNNHGNLLIPYWWVVSSEWWVVSGSVVSESILSSFRRRRLFARRALFFQASWLHSFSASLFCQLPSFRRRRISARRAPTHYSNIPTFHQSNCERSELSSNEFPGSWRNNHLPDPIVFYRIKRLPWLFKGFKKNCGNPLIM